MVKTIIIDNSNGVEGTFIYKLHEHNYFDRHLFEELCNILSKNSLSEREKFALSKAVFKVYSYILTCMIAHLDEGDLSSIINVKNEELYEFREQIELALLEFYG